MASKAWDSSLRLPGLIAESRTVIDGIVEMSGRLAAAGAKCPDCAMPSTALHYATHKTAVVRAWLARRPHYHVHFTPTSASWINQVARWFAELTRKQLRRGVHTLTSQLEQDIRTFIERHNENPKPYR